MKNGTPEIPTHLLVGSEAHFIKYGSILRKLSLDELPNLINVMRGEMVFVGPRPALHNQTDLIELRTKAGIHTLKPGITGWAQINGRDNISIEEKVDLDKYYLEHKSVQLNAEILLKTIVQVLNMKNVSTQ